MWTLPPRARPVLAGLVALLLLGPLPPLARAEDPGDGAKEGAEAEDDGLMPASDAQAKQMADALKKAARKKELGEIMPALEAIDGLKHPSFTKPLRKLMKHKLGEAALLATDRLAERCDAKGLVKMFKTAFGQKVNKGRFAIRARVIRAFGEHAIVLDKNQYRELERDWRWMFGNPQERFVGPVTDLVKYFELTKDKRHCRKLAEQIDEPVATNPNAASNPPAEWWERRWKMWRPLQAVIVEALAAITGQEFDSTEQAKKWFQENEKTFGFDW